LQREYEITAKDVEGALQVGKSFAPEYEEIFNKPPPGYSGPSGRPSSKKKEEGNKRADQTNDTLSDGGAGVQGGTDLETASGTTDDAIQQADDTIQQTDTTTTNENPNFFGKTAAAIGGAISAVGSGLYALVTFKWWPRGAESPATEKKPSARCEATLPTTA
jgi:hypothetical protein